MDREAVQVKSTDYGFSIEIRHALAGRADADLVADCVRVMLSCAEKNGCLDGKVNLNANCLESFAAHDRESNCVTSCFGCA